MNRKKVLVLILIFSFLLSVNNVTWIYAKDESDLQLYAQSAVLMDADSGRILLEKNGQEIRPMASTTKIMTCILALEYGKFDDVVTFSSAAASQPQVRLGAPEGEQFLLRDLLYSLMLESHNDTAVAIAERISGSADQFAALMNGKARELGCQATYFITPNGLDASDQQGTHSTTAADLAKIMRYCIGVSEQKDQFLTITQADSYSFSDTEGVHTYQCSNHNSFLHMMAGALSGKTGFTSNAGYCYVGALRDGERTFIVALLACGWPNNKSYKWSDTQKLMNYGLEHYTYQNVWREIELSDIIVNEGIPDTSNAYQTAAVGVKVDTRKLNMNLKHLLLSDTEKVVCSAESQKEINAPAEQGTKVGKVTYTLGEQVLAELPIVTAKSVNRIDFIWSFQYICKIYFLC